MARDAIMLVRFWTKQEAAADACPDHPRRPHGRQGHLPRPATCGLPAAAHHPDWVLNAGGALAVDQAESEPELALAVNGGVPRAFAQALLETGGQLLQVSKDCVFNGQQGSPYRPEQPRDPLGVYAATKAKGYESVEQLLAASGQGVILRTSWVMGSVGKNFELTMLQLRLGRHRHGERKLSCLRAEGKLLKLTQRFEAQCAVGQCGIGHTRWATHGKPEERNAHPPFDGPGRVAVVRNGIIQNCRTLRNELQAEGVVFRSDIDTEVITSEYQQIDGLRSRMNELNVSECKPGA